MYHPEESATQWAALLDRLSVSGGFNGADVSQATIYTLVMLRSSDKYRGWDGSRRLQQQSFLPRKVLFMSALLCAQQLQGRWFTAMRNVSSERKWAHDGEGHPDVSRSSMNITVPATEVSPLPMPWATLPTWSRPSWGAFRCSDSAWAQESPGAGTATWA